MQLFAIITAIFAFVPTAAFGGGDDDKKAPPAFDLELKSNVLARGLDVTLGEIADVTPAGTDSLAIGALRFGPAPIPGFPRAVTRGELMQTLAAAGHAVANFRFKGATETLVQTIAVEVSPNALTDAATTVLDAVLAQEGGDVEYEVAGRVRSLQVQPGRRSQELRARVRGGATSPSSAVVDIDVLVDGEVGKTVPMQFKLTRFQQVLKVATTIRAGTPFGGGNVTLTRERLSQVTGLYFNAFDQVAGKIARRNLQPNQLLSLADVTEPALIHKGEIVTVIVTRGRVKVTVRAIASEDAARGEAITVLNIQSRAAITGIATAPGTVVVPTN